MTLAGAAGRCRAYHYRPYMLGCTYPILPRNTRMSPPDSPRARRSDARDGFAPARHLILVADSITRLRRVDVARLFADAALDTPAKQQAMADYICTHRADLAAEVAAVRAEGDLEPTA